MDEDIDFLSGPFPRSSPSQSQKVGNTFAEQRETSFREGNFQPEGIEQRVIGGPSIYTSSSNLDNPLPIPFGYDLPSMMNSSYVFPSQSSQSSQNPQPFQPFQSSQNPQSSQHPAGTTPLPYKNMLNPAYMTLNCIDVANHLTACPVCSRLHKSNSSIFMGIIVFLIILILFLGRKFFE